MIEVIREDFEKANTVLSQLDGEFSRLWSYNTNFNIIEILLFSNKSDDNIFVTLKDCIYFRGTLNMSNSALRLSEKEDGIFEINDSNSDFKIIFESGFIVKKGIHEDFFDPHPYEVDLDSMFADSETEEE